MSAYGVVVKPAGALLPSTLWPVRSESRKHLTVHHLTLAAAATDKKLLDVLHGWFAEEVEGGLTYPQEGEIGRDAFEGYFFAGDVFVAVVGCEEDGESELSLEGARRGREWESCVAGFYYVKPNYPGRSSHICNAGFVVPPSQRGQGYGTALARSFLHYGPRLGYQASVFNLVYVNNTASVRIWEGLGFTKVGLLPRAGRLRKRDGEGEEFVDAFIFYKQF